MADKINLTSITAFSIRPEIGDCVGSLSFSSFLPLVTPFANFLRNSRSMSCYNINRMKNYIIAQKTSKIKVST